MIIIDESKLTNGCIEMIGNAYGMTYDHNDYDRDTYEDFIDDVVERFKIDVDEFSERLVVSILNNIHNAFELE